MLKSCVKIQAEVLLATWSETVAIILSRLKWNKNRQKDSQTQKLCENKENHKQNSPQAEEKICKWCDWGIEISNIQTTHTTQL